MADLNSEPSSKPPNYTVVAQSLDELQNSASLSMAPFLMEQGRVELLTKISVYAERGNTREQMRLLYMNATALSVWKELGMKPREIGVQHRPSRESQPVFGVPFSE
jgi:hypothetical protein